MALDAQRDAFFKPLIPQPERGNEFLQPQPNDQKRLTLAEKMALDAQRDALMPQPNVRGRLTLAEKMALDAQRDAFFKPLIPQPQPQP
jgi:hypothetical protein